MDVPGWRSIQRFPEVRVVAAPLPPGQPATSLTTEFRPLATLGSHDGRKTTGKLFPRVFLSREIYLTRGST